MNWIELASAVGVGTIVAKFIDIKYLQPYIAKKQLSVWLRDKRFHAFSKLTKNLIAFGLEEQGNIKSPFEHYAIASDALLLIDNRNLCKKIDQFIVKRDAMERKMDKSESSTDLEKTYESLVNESRDIIVALRRELRNDET